MNVTPTLQAERILAAWEAGDEPLLNQELRKSQKLDYALVHGLDEERMELLQAVSEGMLRAVSQGRRDPAVRPCLDLLAHLARRPPSWMGAAQLAANTDLTSAPPR